MSAKYSGRVTICRRKDKGFRRYSDAQNKKYVFQSTLNSIYFYSVCISAYHYCTTAFLLHVSRIFIYFCTYKLLLSFNIWYNTIHARYTCYIVHSRIMTFGDI